MRMKVYESIFPLGATQTHSAEYYVLLFKMMQPLRSRATKMLCNTSYNMFGSFNNLVDAEIDRNYNPIIVPKYWNGVLPHTIDFDKFTIDC